MEPTSSEHVGGKGEAVAGAPWNFRIERLEQQMFRDPNFDEVTFRDARSRWSALAFAVLVSAASASARPQSSMRQSSSATVAMQPLAVLSRAKDVGPSNPDDRLSITINFAYARALEMQAFVDSVSDPKSSNYRRFITPEQIGVRFGQPSEKVQAVADYLVESGFSIKLVAKNHIGIIAESTVARAEAAFHTLIRKYELTPENEFEPARFFAYSKPLSMPADLAPIVTDVTGLENYSRPIRRVTLLDPALTRGCYDLANMFSAGIHGEGRSVGIANWAGIRASNYLLYINRFNLPVPVAGAGSNVTTVPCEGGGASFGPDDPEGDLDVQMEIGMAPLADVRIYDGNPVSGTLNGMLTVMANDNATDVLSDSYGWINLPDSTMIAAHNLHLAMSAEGITYLTASGDRGTNIDFGPYPDIDPDVLTVGGTIANVDSTTGARLSEVSWGFSTGGWSKSTVPFNVKPAWQVGPGVLNINKRLVPDVAFHSAGSPGGAYAFYTGNGTLTKSDNGTSFASPIFAGMIAIVEQKAISLGGLPPDANGKQRFGRIADLIYSQGGQAGIWFDIISGASNGTLPDGSASKPTPGWDTVTGWGPMDCEAFALAVASQGCTPPSVYCTAKVNSQLCLPAIDFNGIPSASAGAGFFITAKNVINNKSGLFFYSYNGQQAAPFQGGTLCAKLPLKRTGLQSSGGNAPPNDCSGLYSLDFNAFVKSGVDAGLIAGAIIDGQYWARDPGFSAPDNTSLTDAIHLTICP